MASTPILAIPTELIIKILLELHFTDVLSCLRTCRTMLEIGKTSVRLNYHIQLHRAGFQDNPRCKIPVTERLEALQEQERRWASLMWKTKSTIDIPTDSCYPFKLSPSAFIMGISSKSILGVFSGLRIAQFNLEKAGPMLWKDFVFEVDIVGACAAIEQYDLLAFIVSTPNSANSALFDHSIFLWRYSTNDWHDAPKETILPLYCTAANYTARFRIEIYGENLVITGDKINLNKHSDPDTILCSMLIYDWKTGRNKTPKSLSLDSDLDMVFIQENIIAYLNDSRGSLDLYHIPSSEAFTSDSKTEVRLICRLLLPMPDPSWCLTNFHNDIGADCTEISICPELRSEIEPFANDPVHDVLLFFIAFRHKTRVADTEVFTMFARRKSLLDHVPSECLAANGFSKEDSLSVDLPWEMWGPSATRWLIGEEYCEYSEPFGQRSLVVLSPGELGGLDNISRMSLQVFNFNPWTVKMACQGLLEGLETVGIDPKSRGDGFENKEGEELEENLFSGNGVFVPPLVCRLPYARTTKCIDWPHNVGLLNGDMLLGPNYTNDPNSWRPISYSVMHFG